MVFVCLCIYASFGNHIYLVCLCITLFRNDWKTAKIITNNIEKYFTETLDQPEGCAYAMYKKHGTALRGLQKENVEFDLKDYLEQVHDIPNPEKYISPDPKLKKMLDAISVDKWVFTASVSEHAMRCMNLLGVGECFTDHPVIDVRVTEFYTKHDPEAYELAALKAGQPDMSQCYIVDDSTSNIKAAKQMGWNTVLVGHMSRDGKDMRKFEFADHVIDTIHELPSVWPHLFALNKGRSPQTETKRDDAKSKGVSTAEPKKKNSKKKKSKKAD